MSAAPARDDYQHYPVVGPYAVNLAAAHRHRTYFGLSHKATLLYGTLRDTTGLTYAAIRKLGWESASPLTIQTTRTGDAFRIDPATARAFRVGRLEETIDDDVHCYASVEGAAGEPLRFEHRVDQASWSEGGLLELTGGLVGGCGVQWYDPSPPGGFYTSEQYRAAGTVLGAPVEGFFAFDQLYLPPGMTWLESPYFASPPYLEIAWHTFATEFDDGTVEAGQVFFGGQRLSFAAIVDGQGPSVFTTDVSAELTAAPDGYPSEIVYCIDGQPWHWTTQRHLRMPDFSAGYPDDTYRPSDGLFVRAGEARRPRVWWSFVDTWTNRRTPW